jgi:tripartite-type tricarboxylate transporter receptor subunit TctC
MKTLLSLAVCALIAGTAQAQTDYPNRPLRQIVPFPPGGGVSESGFPGFEVTVWYGVCAQSAVPKPILAELHATLVRTLELPEMKARLAEATIEASPTTLEEFAAFIQNETDKWAAVVKEANIPKQ